MADPCKLEWLERKRKPGSGSMRLWRCATHHKGGFTAGPLPTTCPHNATGLEALCGTCHETFNPATPDDLKHGQRADGTNCGGAGVLTGWW